MALAARSTKPDYSSQGSAPISADEFSNHRQDLIQLPLKSAKASHWSSQQLDQGHTRRQTQGLITFLYCYTSAPYSLYYFQACKQAGNSDHTVIQTSICILDWHDESCRERFEYVLHRVIVHKNLQDAVKQSGSIEKLKWNSLEKGIIKCLTSITLLYLF